MDNLTNEQRKKNMKAIKSKDTKIELLLRKSLWHNGVRYRKNYSKLIGKPDIAITKYKIVIFCDSKFWHGYDWSTHKFDLKSNMNYWVPKIEKNIERDKQVDQLLRQDGWIVLRFWDFEILNEIDKCIQTILKTIEQGKNK